MTKNIGNTDKAIRLGLAALLIVLYFTKVLGEGNLAILGLVVAAVLVLTSMINFCPLYKLVGVNTCSLRK